MIFEDTSLLLFIVLLLITLFTLLLNQKRHHPSCHDLFFNDDVECVVNARNEE